MIVAVLGGDMLEIIFYWKMRLQSRGHNSLSQVCGDKSLSFQSFPQHQVPPPPCENDS